MRQIFVLMGKSCSGKDTILSRLKREGIPDLKFAMPCTSRPMRDNEVDGEAYVFLSRDEFIRRIKGNELVDVRKYETSNGTWFYGFLPLEEDLDCNHMLIGTLETVEYLKRRYRKHKIVTLYLDLPDDERVVRILKRNTNFKEICRRYLADEEDFAPSKFNELEDFYKIDNSQSVDHTVNRIKEIVDAYDSLSNIQNKLMSLAEKR